MNIPLVLKAVLCALMCNLVGGLSALATRGSIDSWYQQLNKPSFNPPGWVFGPAWTLLYTLMGIALALIWHQGWDNPLVRKAIYIFAAQLCVNAFWSIAFFGMQSPPLALGVITLLLVLIVTCMVMFAKINPIATYLLVPYLLWVSFATLLNVSIVMLN